MNHLQRQEPSARNAPAPSSAPPAATSLLDQPPQAAKLNLAAGRLTVQADNSSLSGILRQISETTGMKIDGLRAGGGSDQRIFGSYGPGSPCEVLSELLNGSGYNVLMLGETASGAPRELSLSLRTSGAIVNAPPQPPDAGQDDSSDDDVQPVQYADPQPELAPAPPPDNSNRVRTPQQLLEEMQRNREQQQAPPQ